MKKALISVIMSVYKENKDELEKSINSILNQTYKNIEFIIVIDNPEEQWRIDYINSFKDNRIKLIINEKNLGLPNSLNKAIKLSHGSYIARMDADDISELTRLEKQANYLNENDLDICGSYVKCFYNNKIVKENRFPISSNGIHKMLYKKNCIAHPTYFLKKDIYEQLDGYKNIYSCEDYEFLLRVDKHKYKMGNIPEFLLNYRLTENSISRSNPGKQVLISNYVKKWYKNNDIEISTKDIDDYLESKEYKKSIANYDKYWKIRNIRNAKRKNIFSFIYYSIISMKYFNLFFEELYIKLYEFKIMRGERHEKVYKKNIE